MELNPQSGPGSFVAAMGRARETLPKTSGVYRVPRLR